MLNNQNTNQNLTKEIGRNIANLRRKRNMSQMDLADKIGVSSKQLSKYEIGRNRIAIDRLILVSQILDIDIINFLPLVLKNQESKDVTKSQNNLINNNFSKFRKLSGEDLLLMIVKLI